jgi:hypothetical protein
MTRNSSWQMTKASSRRRIHTTERNSLPPNWTHVSLLHLTYIGGATLDDSGDEPRQLQRRKLIHHVFVAISAGEGEKGDVDGEVRLEADGNGGALLQSPCARLRHSLLLLVPRTTAATKAKQMEGVTQMEEGGTKAPRVATVSASLGCHQFRGQSELGILGGRAGRARGWAGAAREPEKWMGTEGSKAR